MKILLVVMMLISGGTLKAQINHSTDLLKALTSNNKVYGAYCGIAGQHPPSRILVEQLIIKEDIQTLKSWLGSPNFTIQTYAAEAFIRLERNGRVLGNEIQIKINELRESETLIPTCKGCIYEERSIKECLEVIDELKIEDNTR